MAIDSHDELLEAYLDFFKTFQTDEGDFKYVNDINKMIREGERSLTVEYDDLVLMDDIYDLEISTTLTENPAFTIEIGSKALAEQVKIENQDYHREVTLDKDTFAIRFANPPTPIQIRDIRANHVDSIRWLEGIVIRTTEIRSIITEAIYLCTEPNQHRNIMIFQDGIYSRPDRCFVETCKAKDFVLDPRESKMIDWQIVTLQEKPEDLPPGASPKSLPCRLIDDIVNTVRPGDRVHLGGLVRTRPTKMAKKGQILTYDMWVDVNFIESLTKEDEYADISLEEEKAIRELAEDPKIHERLLESVAPAIYGMEKVKEAALLMLFGGVDKTFPDGFTTRGQSNLLLVGDPGVAKSQLLRYIQGVAPRGLYTSGRGSSAAGLTAAIIRDPDTSEISLEAGALVLADRGICLIDEFDKMNENDRSAIHEAMEQHTISIAKAGIVATLNARTGVLAAANPKYGRYEPHRTFSENVNLSPAILSRFDLVFILKDEPEAEKDQILASHILNLHRFHGTSQSSVPTISEELLKKYIAFAKTYYRPVLSEEASDVIEEFYVNMRISAGRTEGGEAKNRVTITARQLEGIIRMAEARARAGLRSSVTKHDALKAIELMNFSLSQIAVDPTTGEADIDGFYSGQTSSKRSKLTKLLSIVDFLYRDAGGAPFEEELLLAEAENEGIAREYTKGVVQQMLRDGQLYQPKTGWIKRPDS